MRVDTIWGIGELLLEYTSSLKELHATEQRWLGILRNNRSALPFPILKVYGVYVRVRVEVRVSVQAAAAGTTLTNIALPYVFDTFLAVKRKGAVHIFSIARLALR